MKNVTLYDKTYTEVQSNFFAEQRKKSGRTLEDIAYFLRIKVNTYWTYEKGTRDMPMSVFIDLCRFYNLDYVKVFKDLNVLTEKTCGRTALDDRPE